ncbi:A-kinase anchor protein 12 [Takifugu rubripes]|uniref:A-kinase anchor protein 12 n=1 Tax=Takifugu rubripes TaxID=31033 RepID=UPI00114539DD|nr:A-kinase anchor protein 12-like [Takifugu rubripes]
MGDVQSTQRGSRQDAAAEEESRDANHPQTEQNTDHENSEQTSDFSRKGDEVKMNGCCEDENGAQGLPLIPTKEAAPDTQGNKEELQREGDNDGMHLEITEMDVKQNEMNPFGRIFSNIGLKLTINRGLGEMARNDGKRINTEKSEQTKTEKTEDKAEGQTVQEGSDPACSILTGVTSSEVLGGSDKTVKAAEEPEGEADSVAGTQEDEPHSTNSSGPGDVEIDSPIRKFFATGSFAGLWKKKEPDDEPTEKELEEVGGSQAIETTGQTVQEQHEGKVTPPGEHKENELRGEMLAKTPECDILSSQERDRVQMSPLLRFLSGSSLKRLSMKQRNVKSSEARLCDSGEHPPELLPSDPAEDHRNASSPTSAEAAKEEEGPWASFKRFMSPKPRMKKSYHSAEETQQPAPVEELKAEQTFDHSSEEGKKRKNSSVSWEAVLCGSGRRRSRKTSDSEDEMPPIDLKHRKEDAGAKSGGESGAENEKETSSSFKQDGTLQEGDGGSAWKSLKRIVTPKRKSRDEDERMKINIQPDAECAEENSSFSIKNLLQGRKKQRSEESQGPVSSGESRKGLASDDEDTETPGVVPLSEFEVDEEEKESLDEGEKSELQKEQVAHMNLCFPQDFNEASEKQEDANKGPDEVTKPGGKHQQLSDIQEEGVNTEPGATVTSVLEEVEVRDDAMAEDLIEVASEAFTALEPAADITLQDETEMFTAVSQFSSESAKTSGNATPVPAESDIIETDTLLHQVAETFLTDPKTTTPKPEQIFEAFVEKDSAVHELQRRPGATPNETGLNVKDLETISRLVSASLREGVSKVAEVNSAGFVPTEELDRAETTLEDVRVINVTQKSTNDNEKNIPVSPVEQVEVKSVMDDCQEPVLTSAIGATIEKGDLEQEVQTLTENGDLTKHGIPDHPEDEDEKQPSAEVEGVRDPAEALASGGVVELGEHADMLPLTEETVVQEPEETEDPAEGHVPSHEPNVVSDNISMCSGIETGGDKPEAEPRLLTEAIVEQLDASKSVEEPEDLQAEQASSSKLQEGNMSLDEPQIVSENLARADADKDEADKTQVLTETLELMEAPQETVLQAVQERSANGDVIVLLLETELIPEKGSKAEDEFEPQGLLKPATEADISQPYQASSEMSAEINDSDQIVQLQELNNSTDLTEDALGALEVKASKTVEEPEVLQTASSLGSDKGNITSVETNEKPDTIPKEELHLDENEKETINTEDTIESMEASTIAQEPEVIKPPALASEDIVLPPETVIILKADLDTDEHKTQSTLITEEAADAPKVEEPELAQSVQPSPLESEESIGGPLEREITSDNISEEQTTTDDPPGETIIEAVDDSKTQILEELQTVQTSSLVREESSISPYETEETSDGTLTAEGHIAENKEDTMLHTDYSIESEDEVKVLQEAEELKIVFETSPDEPEDVKSVATEILFEKEHFKTVQTSSFVSEEISIPSIDPEGTSENLLKADLETEEHKMQTNLVTEDTSELLDDPHSVEEAELSPPVQPSCEESENIHDPLLEAEAISHNIPKAETVQEETNEEIILDHVSEEERVPEEPIEEGHTNLQSEDPSETVQEAKALQALQQSLASEETEEATSANLTEEETVHSELKAETPVAAETISESGDESNAAETVEELHTVQTSSLVSEEHSIPALEAEESSENLHGAESDSDEHKVEMVLVPGDTSAPKTPEVPELSQTVQMCSLALGDNETSSDEPEKTSEVILKGETRPDKPRAETTVAGKTINEPENESKTAEVIEELKTVETSPLVSENSSKSTLKAEDTFEEISEVQPDTVENQVEPVLVTVETSQPKTAEEPEPSLQLTVQSSSLESEDNNIPSAEPEMTSEIICKEETVPDEPKEELKLHSEKPLEPEDPSEAVGGAEASSAVNPQSESEEIKLETSDNISEEERVTDEPRDETTLVIETSMEPVDESKYAEQVEELHTNQIVMNTK